MNCARAQEPPFATLPYPNNTSDLMDKLIKKGARSLTLMGYFPSFSLQEGKYTMWLSEATASISIFILMQGTGQVIQPSPNLSNMFFLPSLCLGETTILIAQ